MTMPLISDIALPIQGLVHPSYRVAQHLAFGTDRSIGDHAALLQSCATRYKSFGNADFLVGNNELQRYRDNNNHVFRRDHMALIARSPGVDQPIESGMICTLYEQELGLWAVRAKLPPLQAFGLWPAIWMLPHAGWPPEIDFPDAPNNSYLPNRPDNCRYPHFAPVTATGARQPPAPGWADWGLNSQWSYWDSGMDFSERFCWYFLEWTRSVPPGQTAPCDRFDISICPEGQTQSFKIRYDWYPWKHDDGTPGGPAFVVCDLAIGDWSDRGGLTRTFPQEFKISDIIVATPV